MYILFRVELHIGIAHTAINKTLSQPTYGNCIRKQRGVNGVRCLCCGQSNFQEMKRSKPSDVKRDELLEVTSLAMSIHFSFAGEVAVFVQFSVEIWMWSMMIRRFYC